jgi:hypothetical protein
LILISARISADNESRRAGEMPAVQRERQEADVDFPCRRFARCHWQSVSYGQAQNVHQLLNFQLHIRWTRLPLHPDTSEQGRRLEGWFAGRNVDLRTDKER